MVVDQGFHCTAKRLDQTAQHPCELPWESLIPCVFDGDLGFTVSGGSVLNISGDTVVKSNTDTNADKTTGEYWDRGVYAFYAQTKSQINFNGNVDIEMRMAPDVESEVGLNAIYASGKAATISIGSKDSTAKIWTIAEQPDLISAKNGGSVTFNSTKNQLVGSIDTMDRVSVGTNEATITLSIEGEGYYWYGDDLTMQNVSLQLPESLTDQYDISSYYFGKEINSLFKNSYLVSLINSMLGTSLTESSEITDKLNLTISNGAQWTYFGVIKSESIGVNDNKDDAITLSSIPKRISVITLKDKGIINLYDDNIEDIWKSMQYEDQSLWDLWTDLQSVEHDYVRIGDLKGSGGIFRLDLNSDDHKASDMIFVESSSEAGMHHIEPYRPQDLTSISQDNRLIFALTAADANGVTFDETENIYGETLYDYELGISHGTIDETKAEQIAEIESMVSNYDTFTDFDIADFYGGTSWFINRLTITQSAASLAMGSAGFAAYDVAIEMDRRDRRLLQTFKDEETGLWVRARHGERGVKNEYGYQLNGFAVGTDYAFSDTNALGIAFSFEKGDTDFKSVMGDGNMKRYELAVYNTHDFGAPYLDFVGRLGIVKSDYTAYNQSRTLSTSGDFDQKYATLSAEAGYTLEDTNGVFIVTRQGNLRF